MKYEQGAPVPIIRDPYHPYMIDLFARSGVDDPTDGQKVLDTAEAKWKSAADVAGRVEATELLMGRRVGGGEMRTLPFELVAAIMDGGMFDVAYNGIARAIEIGEA